MQNLDGKEGWMDKTSITSETTTESNAYRNQIEINQKRTAAESDDITGRNKSKDIGKRRKTQKGTRTGSNYTNKRGHSKITKKIRLETSQRQIKEHKQNKEIILE